MAPRARQYGFTLVEFALVLVIIGLLTGGVLVGYDLVRSAQRGALIQQNGSIEVAFITFKTKYNCFPGDCRNATSFFSSPVQPQQVTNGNGDGKVEALSAHVNPVFRKWDGYDTDNATTPVVEANLVFDHLGAAGMFNLPQYDETDWFAQSGMPGIGFPIAKFQGKGDLPPPPSSRNYIAPAGLKVVYMDSNFHIRNGHNISWSMCAVDSWSFGWNSCGLNPQEAWDFDTKLDDGQPYSGNFYVVATGQEPYRVPGSGDDLTADCGNAATNSYRSGDSLRACSVMIRPPF